MEQDLTGLDHVFSVLEEFLHGLPQGSEFIRHKMKKLVLQLGPMLRRDDCKSKFECMKGPERLSGILIQALENEVFTADQIFEVLISNMLCEQWTYNDSILKSVTSQQDFDSTPSTSDSIRKIINPAFIEICFDIILEADSLNLHSKNVESSIVLALKSLKSIIDSCRENAKILSESGLSEKILGICKSMQLSGQGEPRSLKQQLILSIVEKINRYSITPNDLRKYIEYLRHPSCPNEIFDILISLTDQPQTPSAYIRLNNIDSSIKTASNFLVPEEWPPKKGYTLAFWFYTQAFGSQAFSLVHLISKSKKTESTVKILLHDGIMRIHVQDEDWSIANVTFKTQTWYHITISHGIEKESKESTMRIYINGVQSEVAYLKYVPNMDITSFECSFGTSQRLPQSHLKEESVWCLGNAILLNTSLKQSRDGLLLYMLGPNYKGGLRAVTLSHLAMNICTEDIISHTAGNYSTILAPDISVLHKLESNIMFVFSSHDRTFTSRDQEKGYIVSYGVGTKDLTPSLQYTVSESLSFLGGISVIIYFIATSPNTQHVKNVLKIMSNLLKHNSRIRREMKKIGGYGIISRVLRKIDSLDHELLTILLDMSGVENIIHDTYAIKYFLMDWKIWCRAPIDVQSRLFEAIYMSTTGQYSAFNILRLKSLKIRTSLTLLLEEDALPTEISHSICQCIEALMDNPWEKRDIGFVLRFLVATHNVTRDFNLDCPHGVQHKSINYTSIAVGLQPTLKNIHPSLSSQDPYSLFNSHHKRDLILEMIINRLKFATYDEITLFEHYLKEEVLLALLQTHFDSTSCLLLTILKQFLRRDSFEEKFKAKHGYVLLGEILRQKDLKEDHISILLSVLLGRDITLPEVRMSGLHSLSQPFCFRPNVVITILMSTTSCYMSCKLKHQVIKILHDIFLTFEHIQTSYVATIDYLTNILVVEFEHQITRIYYQSDDDIDDSPHSTDVFSNASGSGGSKKTINKSVSGISIEEDIIQFLKTIIMVGITTKDIGIIWLQDVLLSLQNLSVPEKYSRQLQKRILYEILQIFNESTFNNASSLEIFHRVLILSIQTIIFAGGSKKRSYKLQRVSSASSLKLSTSSQTKLNSPSKPKQRISSSTQNSPLLRSKFWEILETSSGSRTLKGSRSSQDLSYVSTEETSNNTDTGSSTDDSSFTTESDILDSLIDSSKLSSIESNTLTEKMAKKAWQDNDFLVKDKQLVSLVLKLYKKYLDQKDSQSTFKRLSESLRSKIGISTSDGSNRNIYWYMEQFIFYLLKSVKDTDLICLVLKELEALSIQGLFLNDLNFMGLFVPLISDYLSKNTVLKADIIGTLLKSKVLSSLFKSPPTGSHIDLETTEIADKVHQKCVKLERINLQYRKQSISTWQRKFADHQANEQFRLNQMKHLASTSSYVFIQMQQSIIKPLMVYVKSKIEEEKNIRRNWKKLIKRVSHEKGPWPIDQSLIRWVLDPTECSLRIVPNLMPIYAHKHPIIGGDLIMRPEFSRDPKDVYLTALDPDKVQLLKALESQLNEEEFDMDILESQETVSVKERILATLRCSKITPFHKRNGDLLIGEENLFFIDNHQFSDVREAYQSFTSVKKNYTWPLSEIKELHKRKHMLINNAMEIFLIDGKTEMLAFEKILERDEAFAMILKMPLPNFSNSLTDKTIEGSLTKLSLTEKWRTGMITNFEYLMYLNSLAGRTYNDLTQYPVFPFILADYYSDDLDLQKETSFRDLSKPMGAQETVNSNRVLKFIEKYETLLELNETPYFYGTHYSNMGSVLHFLIRMEPFSQYFVEFQSGRFDVPDRVFYSIAHTWDLSSTQSMADVKELIPQFFYLPDFLLNLNKFDFGVKQDGVRVDDVILPPWAHNSPRLFVYKHMEALESDYVSYNLHHWIDLIFGYKQLGEEAVKARNVFHPYTYEGFVDISSIEDPVEREAIITQINNYGQTPTQLFKKPHPKRSQKYNQIARYDSLFHTPEKIKSKLLRTEDNVFKIYSVSGNAVTVGRNRSLMWPQTNRCLEWDTWDGKMRVLSIKSEVVETEIDTFTGVVEKITCADVSINGDLIVAGTNMSLVYIYKKFAVSDTLADTTRINLSNFGSFSSTTKDPYDETNKNSQSIYQLVSSLDGHTGVIGCIKISSDNNLILTGSSEGEVILWAYNRLRYIRSLPRFDGNIHSIDLLTYTSEIIIVCDDPTSKKSSIWMYTVNGLYIGKKSFMNRITAMVVTKGKPGTSHNVIITGHEGGEINFWSVVDLSQIATIEYPLKSRVIALSVNDDSTCLLSAHVGGHIFSHSIRQGSNLSL